MRVGCTWEKVKTQTQIGTFDYENNCVNFCDMCFLQMDGASVQAAYRGEVRKYKSGENIH